MVESFRSVVPSWYVVSRYVSKETIIDFIRSQNFVSYAAGAVRLSALSGHQVIWVGEYNILIRVLFLCLV